MIFFSFNLKKKYFFLNNCSRLQNHNEHLEADQIKSLLKSPEGLSLIYYCLNDLQNSCLYFHLELRILID